MKSIIFLIIGLILGFNASRYYYNFEHVWPEERDGLRQLNQQMKDDKTERLALIAITQKSVYETLAIDPEKYEIIPVMREKKGVNS